MWLLHTSEALEHIQVALAPNSLYQMCGPCTWPLHLFLWPLHRPLPQKNEPFQLSKRYEFPDRTPHFARQVLPGGTESGLILLTFYLTSVGYQVSYKKVLGHKL
jgi:hypothetical protein